MKFTRSSPSKFPFIFLKTILLLPVFYSIAGASAPVIGLISDVNHQPVPYVTVHNLNDGSWLIGDVSGEIVFPESFVPGDTLEIHRIGFKVTSFVIPPEADYLDIIIPFSPIVIGQVKINARTSRQNSVNMTELSVAHDRGFVESNQILSSIPGTYIKSYGGPAGISTISIDGAPSSHTSISFAGFDLSSAQNGQLDVSQLPPSLLNSISYSSSLNDKNPEFSNSEGSIEIQPDWSKSGFLFSAGSFGHQSMTINLKKQFSRVRSFITFGNRNDTGNYRVLNSVNDQESKRLNNDFSQKFFASTISTSISLRSFINFIMMHTEQDRGVAGLVWSPTPDARRSDSITMFGSKLGRTSRLGFGYIQFLVKRTTDHYQNPQIAQNTAHTLSTYQLLMKQDYLISKRLEMLLYLESKYDFITSSVTHEHNQLNSRAMIRINYKIMPRLSFQPFIAYHHYPGKYSKTDYDLQLIFNSLSNTSGFHLSAGRFYHFPTFNDLYWEPGGNQDLKPEHTTKYSMGFMLNTLQNISFNSLLYYKASDDLILWTPLQSYWQPVNIQKTIRKGFKMVLNWQSPLLPISVNTHYNYNISEDLTTSDYYKKPLRYAPRHSAAAAFSWRPENFLLHLQLNHVSQRIAMYSWPDDQTLAPYTILSGSISYTLKRKIGDIIFTTAVNNLSNEYYETLLGYPEPNRSFRLTITYEYKTFNTKKDE